MAVRVLLASDADQPTARRLDFLRQGHEVAVATDDDDSADVIEAANVFHRVEAQPDVSAILGRAAGREQLYQLDSALQQRIAVAAEILPVAVGPVDRDRAEGRGQVDHPLDVDQRLLHPKSLVLAGVTTLLPGFAQAGVQIFEIPVKGDRELIFTAGFDHGCFR